MRLIFVSPLYLLSVLACIVSGCHSSGKSTEKAVAVERTDTCASDPAHTYEVFIPAHKLSEGNLPLLVAIDPHGSGKTAMAHLEEAASEYPALLVASNLIQNNDPRYMQELDELIADVKHRYPVGDRTYLAGFSGGGRMVLGYAMNHSADGVITSGAFATSQQLSAIKCPVIGLIGMDDFNFLETVQYIFKPENLPASAHIELIKATHEWPEKNRLTNVFGWFRLADGSNRNGGQQQVRQYVREQQARIDSLAGAGDFIQAVCIARTMGSVSAYEKAGSFHSISTALTDKEAYKQQMSRLTESLQYEMKWRQIYGQALMEKDKAWWEKELRTLHEKMNSEPGDMMRMAYKRLSGFVGIACYSYARQFAAQKDVPHLEQILMVYRLAEPDNPDLKHFREELEK